MKWSKFALAAALFGALGMTPAWGQNPGGFYYTAQDANPASPSDAAASMDMQMMMAEEAPAEEEAEEEDELAPWRLFCPGPKGGQITGYIAQGFSWNPQNPADRFNGPMTWMDRANEYQLNEVWVDYRKVADASEKCWDIGGQLTTLYGTNYRWDTSAGFESNWNSGQFYGLAVPNAYVEVAHCKWKAKLGRFVSPVGYYTVGTGNNFFNLIPYTYQYGEPFTHTGAYFTHQTTDDLVLGAGITGGWDSSFNWNPAGTAFAGLGDPYNRHVGYLASATYTNFAKEGDSVAWVGTYGLEPDVTLTQRTPRYLQTFVYTRPLNDCWTYTFQSDYGFQANFNTAGAGAANRNAEWYGINQYLYYKQNDCWSWGANFEWFRDDDGFRVGTVLPSFGSPNARGFVGGPFEGDFFRLMLGPNWTPTANWTIRPTLVYDWYSGPGAAGGAQPYNAGASSNQFLLNLDAYFVF